METTGLRDAGAQPRKCHQPELSQSVCKGWQVGQIFEKWQGGRERRVTQTGWLKKNKQESNTIHGLHGGHDESHPQAVVRTSGAMEDRGPGRGHTKSKAVRSGITRLP